MPLNIINVIPMMEPMLTTSPHEFDMVKLLSSISILLKDMKPTEISSFIRVLNLHIYNKLRLYSPHLTHFIMTLYSSTTQFQADRPSAHNKISRSDFHESLRVMRQLEWHIAFEKVFVEVFVSIVGERVKDICFGNFDVEYITELKDWIQSALSGFIISIYGDSTDSSKSRNIMNIITSKHLHMSISKCRATELFEIVGDFPDSLPVLAELRDAMVASGSIGEVGQVFRTIVKKRLLHLGASTSQILDMYILIIKALRVLDSSDLMLNFVSRPVRQYLLSRKDTVRCITLSLTDNPDSNLHGELRKGGTVLGGGDNDDEDDNGPGENWMPRKRNPMLMDTSKSKSKDILAALVSIYGSSDVFVQEYRSLLAEKLLSNMNYNIDQEIATVELLKMKFGEEAMHNCEIMLHDIENSKRVNNAVTSAAQMTRKNNDFLIDYAIVSENYWPRLDTDDSSIKHHDHIFSSLKSYEDTYAAVKKPRKIIPINHLGLVEVELSFDDGTIKAFVVSPQQASIINHIASMIESKVLVTLQNLSTAAEIDETQIKSTILFWMSRNVVREILPANSSSYYEIIENQADMLHLTPASTQDYVQDANYMSLQRESKNISATLEPYIKGLLSSHGTMTIERIHNMLRLLASGSSDIAFDMNLVQFRLFMQTLIEVDQVDLIDGQYRLHGSLGGWC